MGFDNRPTLVKQLVIVVAEKLEGTWEECADKAAFAVQELLEALYITPSDYESYFIDEDVIDQIGEDENE